MLYYHCAVNGQIWRSVPTYVVMMAAVLLVSAPATAAPVAVAPARAFRLTVGRTVREAVVFAPHDARKVAAPLVFAFHGHGGKVAGVTARFDFQSLWPEAIVVYPQGLPIASGLDPEGEKPGWQHNAGELDDRD